MSSVWLLWLAVSMIAGYIAHRKNRRIWLWMILSFVSATGIIILLLLPKVNKDLKGSEA